MSLKHIKMTLAAAWVLAAFAVAIAAGVDSSGGRIALVAFGLLPPLSMWFLWNDPSPTMSESINKGRR